MERWTKIGCGNDSTVYLAGHKRHVMKIYDGVIAGMDLEKRLPILNSYADDMRKASQIFNNHKISRSFYLGEERYDVRISVHPLGKIREVFPKNFNDMPRSGNRKYLAAVGQTYIEGDHAGSIFDSYDDSYTHDTEDSIFHYSINSFESCIKASLRDIQEILYRHLRKDFIIGYVNVKPILDKENKSMRLEVTDIADSILSTYA